MMLCISGLRCQLEGVGEGDIPNDYFYKVVDVEVFFPLFLKFKEEETTCYIQSNGQLGVDSVEVVTVSFPTIVHHEGHGRHIKVCDCGEVPMHGCNGSG